MICKRRCAFLFLLVLSAVAMGQQLTSPYILTEFPLTAVSGDTKVWVKWTGIVRPSIPGLATYSAPDSGILYFDKSPGGSKIANYRYKVTAFCVDTLGDGTVQVESNRSFGATTPPIRGIRFRPMDQVGMDVGVFYFMVAFKTSILGHDTVFYSNEMQMIVESPNAVKAIGPSGNITQLTPTFSWNANPGVPYYHVILSDEPLNIDNSTGSINVTGLSIVWQAITPQTQIVYGAPDPSGTITASPPPMSPGQTYSWVVLNNYGNAPAYTSTKYGLPQTFTIVGVPLQKPALVTPLRDTMLTYEHDSMVTFKWTNLDSAANTYQVYIYMTYAQSGSQSVNAKLVVWQNEVTAGSFAKNGGKVRATDTGSMTINARSILTNNHYSWKVFAVDNKGASTASDTASFQYFAPATGTMKLYTRERINTGTPAAPSYIISPVTAVEMDVQVLNGSLEAPLLFYTDLSGNLSRDRPVGTYRVTANKSGFDPLSMTITLDSAKTVNDTFYLQRPVATMYGKVLDATSVGVAAATITAVSQQNDTVLSHSDASGNYIVNCSGGDWIVNAMKTGYISSLQRIISVVDGDNKKLDSIVLQINPLTLSGVVKNGTGDALLGADVKVQRQGTTIAENPSTSQDGTFSFSLTPGTYTLRVTKVGFTTYDNSVSLSSSMQMTVSMSAGAALITGYAIGRSWIGLRQIYGPITNAVVKFTDTTAATHDTFSTIADATYGIYQVSLPGGHVYKMLSSASGFISHARLLPDTVRGGSTMTTSDTLNGLAMVSGNVKLSSTSAAVYNASIALLSIRTGQVVASVRSQSNGYFEMRSLSDDTLRFSSGADGLVTDSIVKSDTLIVANGKPVIRGRTDAESLTVYMSPGAKSVVWTINGGSDRTATIKVQSPLVKNLAATDTLRNTGAGDYIVAVDGVADSIIDLSYHRFTVGISETVHKDSVILPVYNGTKDTLHISHDSVSLLLHATVMLDSAILYFRDVNMNTWDSLRRRDSAASYVFSVKPQQDGSTMFYYFKAFKGSDLYGYNQETFSAYIPPDTTKLTKLAILPVTTDTLLLPAGYALSLSVKGYYGAQFKPMTLDSSAVTWRLDSAQGCVLAHTKGVSNVVTTGSAVTLRSVKVRAIIDTSIVHIDTRRMTSNEAGLYFKSSGKAIASINVKRTDAQNGLPITTSSLSKAEFAADGLDADSNAVSINPVWSISPVNAGTISADGVFKPDRKFAGIVHVWAQSGGLSKEYVNPFSAVTVPGIDVQHIVMQSPLPDTMVTGSGCTIILPDSIVSADKPALFSVAVPTVENLRARMTGSMTAIGSIFDISELNGVTFTLSSLDSIYMVLDVPKNNAGSNVMKIGTWNTDSLKWTALANSVVSADKASIRAAIRHFSRYAILAISTTLQSSLDVSPNPFSPERSPSEFPALIAKFGMNAPKGTRISFTADVPDQTVRKCTVRIYNVNGDLVTSVVTLNLQKLQPYSLWWDGRASNQDINWNDLVSIGTDANSRTFAANGRKLLRNGRYFVVLTIEDAAGKDKSYMKQVILVK